MFEAQSSDVGVKDQVARDFRFADEVPKNGQVSIGLGEECEPWRSTEYFEVFEGQIHGHRGLEHAGMRDDPQEFIDAWPRNGPRCGCFAQFAQDTLCVCMLWKR